jgi:hypothetical protein
MNKTKKYLNGALSKIKGVGKKLPNIHDVAMATGITLLGAGGIAGCTSSGIMTITRIPENYVPIEFADTNRVVVDTIFVEKQIAPVADTNSPVPYENNHNPAPDTTFTVEQEPPIEVANTHNPGVHTNNSIPYENNHNPAPDTPSVEQQEVPLEVRETRGDFKYTSLLDVIKEKIAPVTVADADTDSVVPYENNHNPAPDTTFTVEQEPPVTVVNIDSAAVDTPLTLEKEVSIEVAHTNNPIENANNPAPYKNNPVAHTNLAAEKDTLDVSSGDPLLDELHPVFKTDRLSPSTIFSLYHIRLNQETGKWHAKFGRWNEGFELPEVLGDSTSVNSIDCFYNLSHNIVNSALQNIASLPGMVEGGDIYNDVVKNLAEFLAKDNGYIVDEFGSDNPRSWHKVYPGGEVEIRDLIMRWMGPERLAEVEEQRIWALVNENKTLQGVSEGLVEQLKIAEETIDCNRINQRDYWETMDKLSNIVIDLTKQIDNLDTTYVINQGGHLELVGGLDVSEGEIMPAVGIMYSPAGKGYALGVEIAKGDLSRRNPSRTMTTDRDPITGFYGAGVTRSTDDVLRLDALLKGSKPMGNGIRGSVGIGVAYDKTVTEGKTEEGLYNKRDERIAYSTDSFSDTEGKLTLKTQIGLEKRLGKNLGLGVVGGSRGKKAYLGGRVRWGFR